MELGDLGGGGGSVGGGGLAELEIWVVELVGCGEGRGVSLGSGCAVSDDEAGFEEDSLLGVELAILQNTKN